MLQRELDDLDDAIASKIGSPKESFIPLIDRALTLANQLGVPNRKTRIAFDMYQLLLVTGAYEEAAKWAVTARDFNRELYAEGHPSHAMYEYCAQNPDAHKKCSARGPEAWGALLKRLGNE